MMNLKKVEAANVLFGTGRELFKRHKNVVKKVCPYIDARRRGAAYATDHDFALEWPKDNHTELDCSKS